MAALCFFFLLLDPPRPNPTPTSADQCWGTTNPRVVSSSGCQPRGSRERRDWSPEPWQGSGSRADRVPALSTGTKKSARETLPRAERRFQNSDTHPRGKAAAGCLRAARQGSQGSRGDVGRSGFAPHRPVNTDARLGGRCSSLCSPGSSFCSGDDCDS